MPEKSDVLQGTLRLMILKTLALEPMHGFGIARRLEQISRGVFRVNPGSFFPALYQMEEDGWVQSEWGLSENKRRAKFYRLTRTGRRKLQEETENWNRVVLAVNQILETS